MSVNPDEDTEFNDALRKHGILPPREPPPRTPSPPPVSVDDLLAELTANELRELGEDGGGADREEMARAADAFLRLRLAQDKAEEKRARFGCVYPISREDYTREVTEASSVDEEGDEEGKGTGVVCFLYKDGIPRSDRVSEHVQVLAQRYPRTKFVSIVGDKCIPNLPDSRLPMFIVYRKGDIRTQILSWSADKDRRLEELEALLITAGAIEPPQRKPLVHDRGDRSDEEEESDDASLLKSRWSAPHSNAQTRNLRTSVKRDDDSDFEFDL